MTSHNCKDHNICQCDEVLRSFNYIIINLVTKSNFISNCKRDLFVFSRDKPALSRKTAQHFPNKKEKKSHLEPPLPSLHVTTSEENAIENPSQEPI